MEKQHLTYFKIENFKRFDSFEMSNLGQFNLIVGDNNVGKTSVLEGLLFDEDLQRLFDNFWGAFSFRDTFELPNAIGLNTFRETRFWRFIFSDTDNPLFIKALNNNSLSLRLELIENERLTEADKELASKELRATTPGEWVKLTLTINNNSPTQNLQPAYLEDRSQSPHDYISFLPTNLANSEDLVRFFYQSFNGNKAARKELENNLRSFIPNLEEIRPHRFIAGQDTLSVVLSDKDGIYPISSYGDGTVKLARLLLEMIMSKGKRLMVDEIGSGIHFTRLTSYWKTIIQLCDKYQVQLFATTHSLECQQAFIEALEAPDMVQYQKDARNISLIENKQGKVEAITFDFEQFEYALNIGFNTRGGKR